MGQQTLPPGFRFSPTDEELVLYYLKAKALGKNTYQATIADVDIYKFEPCELPGKAALPSKDQEWYFFSAQDKKYSQTARINRTTKKGYWKATGKDRKVFSGSRVIGLKKTLIYYEGRAPHGSRTNWIMHEYRLDEEFEKKEGVVCVAVLCRIRKKGGVGPRNGEQYGPPILNEKGEVEEESMEKVDVCFDTSRQDDFESRGGGNVYNLTDQVEIWKQMGLANATSDHSGIKEHKETGLSKMESDCSDLESKPKEKGQVEGDFDVFACLRSLSDASDVAPPRVHGGDTFLSCDQYLDVQNPGTLFDSDAFPYLPTLWDDDGHLLQNYKDYGFDESDILRTMSDLINDCQGVVGDAGSMISPIACSVPLGDDYIELNDIKPPLDGSALRPPIYSRELVRSEEQRLHSIADTNETQKFLHSQESAAQTSWLPTGNCYGRHESAQFVLPQGAKYGPGGDISIPISRDHHTNSVKLSSGSYSGAGDLPHVVESGTRSYLSKHVATHAVSKHEMLPAQLCYASSFTDRHKCAGAVNSPPAASSTRAFAIKGKSNIDADTFGNFPTPPMGLPSSPRLIRKVKESSSPVSSPLSSSPPIKSSNRLYVEVPSATQSSDQKATQSSDQKAEYESMSHSNRHRWKAPFRVLVSRAKRTSLGTRLVELENGMRVKFNDKLTAFGKPGARVLPTRDDASPTRADASPYDSLVQGLLVTLCQLVAAMLFVSCLFWGFRVLVSHASSVSV